MVRHNRKSQRTKHVCNSRHRRCHHHKKVAGDRRSRSLGGVYKINEFKVAKIRTERDTKSWELLEHLKRREYGKINCILADKYRKELESDIMYLGTLFRTDRKVPKEYNTYVDERKRCNAAIRKNYNYMYRRESGVSDQENIKAIETIHHCRISMKHIMERPYSNARHPSVFKLADIYIRLLDTLNDACGDGSPRGAAELP